MITGEIRLYDEPLPTYTTYSSVKYTKEDEERWNKKCTEDLDKAKQIFSVGDLISPKNNMHVALTVTSFIEDITKMQRYQEQPCIMYCQNKKFTTSQEVQYALSEFDMSTHVKKETPNV